MENFEPGSAWGAGLHEIQKTSLRASIEDSIYWGFESLNKEITQLIEVYEKVLNCLGLPQKVKKSQKKNMNKNKDEILDIFSAKLKFFQKIFFRSASLAMKRRKNMGFHRVTMRLQI